MRQLLRANLRHRMRLVLRTLPEPYVLPEALRLLQRLWSCSQRAVLLQSLRWLQRRNVLERMAQRSAALPGSVQLPRRLDWAGLRLRLLPELRAVQRRLCWCSGLPVQFEWLCVGGACSQQRCEPCDGGPKCSAGSIAAGANCFAAGESRAGEFERAAELGRFSGSCSRVSRDANSEFRRNSAYI